MSVMVAEMEDRERNIVIQDELRALFRASRRGLSSAPVSPPDGSSAPVPRSMPDLRDLEQGWGAGEPDRDALAEPREAHPPDTGFALGPVTAYRMRCDGRRPVLFDGVLLVERSVETRMDAAEAPLRQTLGLYLSTTGKVVAQIVLNVPEGVLARPVHKVAEISSPAELEAMFADYDPADGWAWCACDPVTQAGLAEMPATTLRKDFERLTIALRDACPPRVHPNPGSET